MKTIITIAVLALLASPVYAQQAPADVTQRNDSTYESAPAEVTNEDAAPESPRSNGGGGSNQKAELKTKIALLEQIVALLQTLIQLRG